jgi:Sulfotransferase family
MPYSVSQAFLFVHVPKAAGTSVRVALEPWLQQPASGRLDKLLSRWHLKPWQERFLPEHASARAARSLLGREVFAGLYKFAFVRNPWERLVSQYRFLLSNPSHRRHRRVLALGSFGAYARFELQRRRFFQYELLTDERGQLLMDFVGRFESLDADFDAVTRRLGISARLPHLNRSTAKPGDWRALYDRDTRALVNAAYAREAEFFGYRFE